MHLGGACLASDADFKTIEQGAATSVLVATSPQLEGFGGRYFEDCSEAPVVDADPDATFGVAAHAVDPAAAARLWQISAEALPGRRGATRSPALRG